MKKLDLLSALVRKFLRAYKSCTFVYYAIGSLMLKAQNSTKSIWKRFSDVTNAEEGTFRVSRHQEHIHSVSDVCNLDECIMVLDEGFPSMTDRGTKIGTDLIFAPARPRKSMSTTVGTRTHRRISETLRIVLSSDGKETHLWYQPPFLQPQCMGR